MYINEQYFIDHQSKLIKAAELKRKARSLQRSILTATPLQIMHLTKQAKTLKSLASKTEYDAQVAIQATRYDMLERSQKYLGLQGTIEVIINSALPNFEQSECLTSLDWSGLTHSSLEIQQSIDWMLSSPNAVIKSALPTIQQWI